MSDLHVLVVGAGLGGLTLAQSLHRQGVRVSVFERDDTPWARTQGYRLHLDADALNAAREVLPAQLYRMFEATAFYTEPFTTVLAPDLSVIKRLPTEDDHGQGIWPEYDGPSTHANVDRATLRQIMLAELPDVQFGKALQSYSTASTGRVVAHFTDGSAVEGDVLVGADGIRSAVRGQRAPGCDTVDAGITAIYGRIPLDAASLVPAEALTDIFTIASDQRKVFLGMGAVRFPTRPAQAAQQFAPEISIREQSDYVVCVVGGRHEYFPATASLRVATAAQLQEIAATTLSEWPHRAGDVVRAGDPSSFFLVEMYTSVPCTLDAPTNVTLLGDAIHAMTPTLGRGANVAMRDGALLGRALGSAATGQMSVAEALTGYERDMLDYGFAVVREAALIGQQRMAQNPLPG